MKQKLLLITLLVLGCAGMAKAETPIETPVWSSDQGFFSLPNDKFILEAEPFERGMTGRISIYYTSVDREYRAMQFECTQASIPGLIYKGIYDGDVEDAMPWRDDLDEPGIKVSTGAKEEDGTGVPIVTLAVWNLQDIALPQGERVHLTDLYFTVAEDAELGKHKMEITHLEFSETNPDHPMPIHFCGNNTEIRPMDPMYFEYEVVDKGATRILDENDEGDPIDSYNGEEQNLIVKRTIKGGQWSTICLPFDIPEEDIEDAFGTTVELAEAASYDYDKTANEITVNFESIPEIYANTPALIRVANDVTEIKYKAAIEVDTEIEERFGKRPKFGYFYGVYSKHFIPENGIFLSGNKFWYSTGISVIKGYRAYFTLTDNIDFSSGLNINVNIDGDATAVEGLTTSTRIDDNVYTISGVNLGKNVDTKKLQPGMYIVNNKKVIVK